MCVRQLSHCTSKINFSTSIIQSGVAKFLTDVQLVVILSAG